jgi:hypothetical protein
LHLGRSTRALHFAARRLLLRLLGQLQLRLQPDPRADYRLKASSRDLPEDPTLLDALELEGGGLEALMRQVAAALLNAASPEVDYPFPVDVVVTKFQASFDLENYDPATAGFESANEAGCPMDTAGDLTETPTASPTPTVTPTATPGLTATIEATPTEAEATMPSPTASSESPTATATPPEATPTSVPSTDQGTPWSGP